MTGIIGMYDGSSSGAGVNTLDGLTWTAHAGPTFDNGTAISWRGLAYAPALDMFAALAHNGPDAARSSITSRNGNTWAQHSAPRAGWSALCWSPTNALFCGVADDNGTDQIITSPTGTTWTTRTPPSSSTWKGVCWSEPLGLFVAVGNNAIMTSSDGITWTARTSPAAVQWLSVCWAGGSIQKFVAVSTSNMMTSTDGITWTAHGSLGIGACTMVNYGEDDGQVVIVSSSGGGTAARSTTPDVVASYTTHNFGLAQGPQAVFRSTILGLWVTTGVNTTTIYTSTDAGTWTAGTWPNGTLIVGAEGILPPGQMAVEETLGISEAVTVTRVLPLPAAAPALGVSLSLPFLATRPTKDVLISWLRRDRLAGAPVFVTDNVPMSEAVEKYDVEIMDAAGLHVLRTFSGLTTNSVLYTAADMVVDGFTQNPDQLTIRVFQLSDVVGRGFGEKVVVDVE